MGCQKGAPGRTRALGWPKTGRASLLLSTPCPVSTPPGRSVLRELWHGGEVCRPGRRRPQWPSLLLCVQLPNHSPTLSPSGSRCPCHSEPPAWRRGPLPLSFPITKPGPQAFPSVLQVSNMRTGESGEGSERGTESETVKLMETETGRERRTRQEKEPPRKKNTEREAEKERRSPAWKETGRAWWRDREIGRRESQTD